MCRRANIAAGLARLVRPNDNSISTQKSVLAKSHRTTKRTSQPGDRLPTGRESEPAGSNRSIGASVSVKNVQASIAVRLAIAVALELIYVNISISNYAIMYAYKHIYTLEAIVVNGRANVTADSRKISMEASVIVSSRATITMR